MSGPILLILRLLLVVCLYAFLGYALLTIWRELKRQSDTLLTHQAPAIRLIRRLVDQTQTYRFSSTTIRIGRDPVSDCMLDDNTVSANHSQLTFHHGQWWVEDRGSRNGTFLNKEPVHEPAVITAGDELQCGQVLFTIELEPHTDSGRESL